MADIYAVRMLWQDSNLAISETYYNNTVTVDVLKDVYPKALALMKLRSLMMGNTVVAVSFRISVVGRFRTYLNSQPQDITGIKVGNQFVNVKSSPELLAAGGSNVQDGNSDQAKACILADSYSTLSDHARKFLAGVPDVLIRESPSGPWIVGDPTWKNAFDAWATALTKDGWAFKAKVQPTQAGYAGIQIDKYGVRLLDGLFWVDMPTVPNPPALLKGQFLQLRGFTMKNRAYKAPNGTYQVNDVAASATVGQTIYYLRGTEAIAATQINVVGKGYPVGKAYYPYVTTLPGKQTTHKRGNRSLASPGRSMKPARVSA